MLAAAGCDRATEPRPREEQPVRHTIAYLKSLCDGAESRLVTREITVRGFITANDRYGEFYKSIVLEDETGGITVAVDQTGTAAEFPFGYVATLHGAGLGSAPTAERSGSASAPESREPRGFRRRRRADTSR